MAGIGIGSMGSRNGKDEADDARTVSEAEEFWRKTCAINGFDTRSRHVEKVFCPNKLKSFWGCQIRQIRQMCKNDRKG